MSKRDIRKVYQAIAVMITIVLFFIGWGLWTAMIIQGAIPAFDHQEGYIVSVIFIVLFIVIIALLVYFGHMIIDYLWHAKFLRKLSKEVSEL